MGSFPDQPLHWRLLVSIELKPRVVCPQLMWWSEEGTLYSGRPCLLTLHDRQGLAWPPLGSTSANRSKTPPAAPFPQDPITCMIGQARDPGNWRETRTGHSGGSTVGRMWSWY